MAIIQTLGVVLRSWDRGDADRTYLIFTESAGKVRALAQGVKRSQSKLAGHLEPLTTAILQLSFGRREKLLQAVAQDSVANLRRTLTGVAIGSAVAELTDQMTRLHARDQRVFALLRTTLTTLDRTASPASQLALYLAFQVKLYALTGFLRPLRTRDDRTALGFDYVRSEFVSAPPSSSTDVVAFSPAAADALQQLFTGRMTDVAATRFPKRVISQLLQFGDSYRRTLVGERPLKSLRFLRTL